MSLLSLLLISAISVSAAEKPACNAKAVTRDCKFFEERKDQRTIQLPDGSRLQNPMYSGTMETPPSNYSNPYNNSAYGSGTGYGGTAEDYEKSLQNQAEMMDILGKGRFSTRFKMSLIPTIGLLSANPNQEFTLPWPPDAKDAETQSVKAAKVFEYLESNLKPADYKDFLKAVEIQKEPIMKAQLLMQKQMQQQLADQQQMAENILNETNRLATRKNHIRELFQYAKENMVSMVRKGAKDDQLSPEQKTAIAKIESVRLRDLDDPEVSLEYTCTSSMQSNAFYQQMSHNVTVCPGYFDKSDAEIVATLAHEIGHSIDPCRGQFPLMSFDKVAFEKYLNQAELSPDEKNKLQQFFKSTDKLINTDISMALNDESLVTKLKKAGALKEDVPGIPSSRYLFKNETQCMAEKNGFRQNDAEDISYTKKLLDSSVKYAGTKEEKIFQEKTAKRYTDGLKKYPQCFTTLKGKPRTTETLADIMGGVILEKYFMDYPPKNEEEKVLSMATWIASSCPPKNLVSTTASTLSRSLAPNVVSQALGDGRLQSHPEDDQRLDKIYLNLPGLASLFNCQRKAVACFDHLSFYNRTPASKKPDFSSKKDLGVQ